MICIDSIQSIVLLICITYYVGTCIEAIVFKKKELILNPWLR